VRVELDRARVLREHAERDAVHAELRERVVDGPARRLLRVS
jgi:hypothetical protein